MCNGYGKACFNHKLLTKRLNICLPLWAWVKKTIHGVETYSLIMKKFQLPQSVKKVMLTVFWEMKGPATIDFLQKGITVNSTSNCELLSQIHFIYWMTLLYIYVCVCVCVCVCWWCNGYQLRKWTRWPEFKSLTSLFIFYIVLILLEKVWTQIFSLQSWGNSRAEWAF